MTRTNLTPDQQADADRIQAALLSAAATDLRALAELLATQDDRTLFGATEFAVRDIVLRVGAKALEAALAERKRGNDGSSRACPHCQEAAKFQRWQVRPVRVLSGVVGRTLDRREVRSTRVRHGPYEQWAEPGLNRRPSDFQSLALPAELPVRWLEF